MKATTIKRPVKRPGKLLQRLLDYKQELQSERASFVTAWERHPKGPTYQTQLADFDRTIDEVTTHIQKLTDAPPQ